MMNMYYSLILLEHWGGVYIGGGRARVSFLFSACTGVRAYWEKLHVSSELQIKFSNKKKTFVKVSDIG